MNLIKLPYEISVWDDVLTVVDTNGNEHDGFIDLSRITVSAQYYKERKLCVIGSNTTSAPFNVVEPKLVRKTDGTSTLTFSIYTKYYDEDSGEFKDNPFVQYLTNERKIKLKYFPNGKMRWLDFIIKKIDETSDNYKFTYTATDLFINELSKTGYNLVFDAELENNQGTVNELGARVLENTDWSVGEDSEIIQQLKDEPLYEIELSSELKAYDIFTNREITIPSNKKIYAFYSVVNGQASDYYQFIYNENGNYEVDENNVAYNVGNYYCLSAPEGEANYTNIFRGERYVRSQETAFDPVLQRYVNVYTDSNGARVYGYVDTEYTAPSLVANYVTNGKTILSASGWAQEKAAELEVDYDDEIEHYGIKFSQSEDNSFLMNTGFRDNAETIKEISLNQEFVCSGLCYGAVVNRKSTVRVQKYKAQDGKITFIEDPILTFNWDKDFTKPSFATATRAVSYDELTDPSLDGRFGIFFSVTDSKGNIVNEDYFMVQGAIFQKQNGFAKNDNGEEEEGIILPGGKVYFENGEISESIAKAIVRQKNHFYFPPEKTLKPEKVEYLYIGEGNPNNYTPVYRKNFEKIRSISKKETNRFDLIQSLSETFECWARFDVWHKDTGEIMLGKDISYLINSGDASSTEDIIYTGGDSYSFEDLILIANENSFMDAYRQQKFVTFHKRIGQKKSIGFTYGINLKSISRTLDSNQIATKLIVKSNSNEFAEGGSCNIATAKENPSGENFVYDFTHYVNQGLLHRDMLNYDLYSLDEEHGWIGLYPRLKTINNERDELIAKLTSFIKQYSHNKSECESARIRIAGIEDELLRLNKEANSYTDGEKKESIENEIKRLEVEKADLLEVYENAKADMQSLENQTKEVNNRLEKIEEITNALINKFEQKYIRFIQEASWISEDYTDDNLYYIDAETTLHKSCQPKASYDIKIIELNQIEGYENYVFDLGDITYVQDPEFFGWEIKNGVRTPYKEEIVITEQTTFFNEPDKSTIKAQNYRKAFEDLFQRLTASAQQLQFHSGEYARAANVVDSKGNILPKSLADAFANNAYVLSNTANQSVKWDEYGITTTNTSNPAEIVRLTSGGMFLTGDGGESWTTGITAKGINAKTITTGQLDTGVVTIGNGDQKAFVWDSEGLNAYARDGEDKYNPNEYVRFNQEGIEGKKGNNTTFKLNEDGLDLKEGIIKIEKKSENDATIIDKVIIDPLGREGNTVFGITSNRKPVVNIDNQGNATFNGSGTFTGDLKVGGTSSKPDFQITESGVNFKDKFTISSNGTATFTGDLKVGSTENTPGFEVTPSGVNFKNNFTVDFNGNITATGGTFTNITATGSIAASSINLDEASITGTLKVENIDVEGVIDAEGTKALIGEVVTEKIDATEIVANTLTVKDSKNNSLLEAGNNAVTIGGWKVENGHLGSGEITGDTPNYIGLYSGDASAIVNNTKKSNWRILTGLTNTESSPYTYNFGVSDDGELHCTDANITGVIQAGKNLSNQTATYSRTYRTKAYGYTDASEFANCMVFLVDGFLYTIEEIEEIAVTYNGTTYLINSEYYDNQGFQLIIGVPGLFNQNAGILCDINIKYKAKVTTEFGLKVDDNNKIILPSLDEDLSLDELISSLIHRISVLENRV